MKLCKPITRFLILAVVSAQTACIGISPPSEFYMLEPLSVAEAPADNSSVTRPILVLAPVRIPDYLDRPQLVTASGKNTYRLDELHRWAESLEGNITRVMQQDLAVLLPASVVLSKAQSAKQFLRLVVTILEFHIDSQGDAVLVTLWHVSRDGETLLSEQNNYRLPASNDDVQLQVQALNRCLNRLSQDVALRLKALKVN